MKGSIICVAVFVIFVLLVPATMSTRNIAGRGDEHNNKRRRSVQVVPSQEEQQPNKYYSVEVTMKRTIPETAEVKVAGSRLPDCSHACGSCSPCRLVMVSFVCASLAEAETCPMAYKCMCRNKSYPVP
ncbi:protein EPIDERMAL PATTERNING FACTOR 2-like [Humulus lupulus]|uniref:protein EPIDERMAL PATTERNING FACTOR 2-like n=1 Tax=Humulus lupulus TaxID=3486 RepID=UPI002B4139C0|nr:protein EPIDERMAL PATTERNING FACTOR 2-like [Humulus lupulus]